MNFLGVDAALLLHNALESSRLDQFLAALFHGIPYKVECLVNLQDFIFACTIIANVGDHIQLFGTGDTALWMHDLAVFKPIAPALANVFSVLEPTASVDFIADTLVHGCSQYLRFVG
jgi:hypothetical protein